MKFNLTRFFIFFLTLSLLLFVSLSLSSVFAVYGELPGDDSDVEKGEENIGLFPLVDTKNSPQGVRKCSFFRQPEGDFKCRCQLNECRLSRDNKYFCVKSAPSIDSPDAQVLPIYEHKDKIKVPGKGDPVFLEASKLFLLSNDESFYAAMGINYGDLNNLKKMTYIDFLVFDGTRGSIPMGSFCKYEPTSGQAYWFYPGFAESITGGSGTLLTSKCSDPLFTSVDLFGKKIDGTVTFFGCLPNSINGVVAFVVRLFTGISLFVTLLIIVINFVQMMANPNNSNIIQKSQTNIKNAITVLLGIITGTLILELVGIQILGISSGILSLFTGG